MVSDGMQESANQLIRLSVSRNPENRYPPLPLLAPMMMMMMICRLPVGADKCARVEVDRCFGFSAGGLLLVKSKISSSVPVDVFLGLRDIRTLKGLLQRSLLP